MLPQVGLVTAHVCQCVCQMRSFVSYCCVRLCVRVVVYFRQPLQDLGVLAREAGQGLRFCADQGEEPHHRELLGEDLPCGEWHGGGERGTASIETPPPSLLRIESAHLFFTVAFPRREPRRLPDRCRSGGACAASCVVLVRPHIFPRWFACLLSRYLFQSGVFQTRTNMGNVLTCEQPANPFICTYVHK